MKKSFLFVLTLVLSTLLGWAAPSSLPTLIPSTGKDFWLTFMQNGETNPTSLRVYVVTGEESANVSIYSASGSALVSGQSVAANSTYSYEVGISQAYMMGSGVSSPKGLHVTSDANVAVYMVNAYEVPGDISYDASPVLATTALGKEYVVQTYYADMKASEFAIVGTNSATNVQVVLSHEAINDGGVPFAVNETINVVLNAGDVYQVKGDVDALGASFLSGSSVMASKPVAVFCGGIRAAVPFETGVNGDHIFEQAIPISAWGKRFVLSEFHGFPAGVYESKATEYSFTAIYDDTKVYVDGALAFTLQKGQTSSDLSFDLGYEGSTILVEQGQSPKFVETSQPVLCYGYMTNGVQNKTAGASALMRKAVGEPSMILIPSTRQGLNRSDFTTYDGATTHYVNVVVPNWAKGSMKLNGANVGSSFSVLSQHFQGDTTTYAYARLALANGHNTLSNDKTTFLSYAYGVTVGTAESYAYVTSFNLAPESPKVYIDDELVEHKSTLDYCNRHPGINFRGMVDYPHDNIVWEFGDGETSTSMTSSHMYGFSLGEETRTNIVNFIVTRHDPLSNNVHKDTVQVKLRVHPTYYDTLVVDICGKEESYAWTQPSADWIAVHGATTLSGTDILGKTAASKVYNFTKTTDTEIVDSLYFKTRTNDCDSIFYIRLRVHPETYKNDSVATICQDETFFFGGKTYKGSTSSATGVVLPVGVNTLKDTLVNHWGCDSIITLNLTINPQPTVGITPMAPICEASPSITVSYTTTNAQKYNYQLVNSSSDVVAHAENQTASASGSFTINTASLPYGVYTLKMTATSDKSCTSEEVSSTLTINVKPTVSIDPLTDICAETASITVSYASTNAATYSYQLLDAASNVKASATDQTIGSSFPIATATLAAGTYTLKMTVKSANDCMSDEATTTLVVTDKPTVSINTIADICEKTASINVTYTSEHAATYSYQLLNAASDVKASAVDQTIGSSFTIATAALAAGTYTLKMTVASAVGCTSEEASTTFTINPQPTVTIDPIDAVCYPTASITVTYGTTDAAKYSYQVYNGATPVAGLSATDATVGTSFNINTSSLAAGTYTLKMTVKSAHECTSEEQSVNFVINPKPEVTINPIAAVCYPAASVVVGYTATGAATYSYKVFNASNTEVASVADQTIGSSFNINTSAFVAGTYTLKMTVKSANDCPSDEVSTTFVINPKPTVSINTIAPVCGGTPSTTITYTATNAATYSYQLLNASSTPVASATDVTSTGSFSLATSTLAAGTYTLKMTVKSANDCPSDEASQTLVVNVQPTVTLDAIAAICQGDAVATVSYHTTDAAKYSYQVLNASNSVVASAANQTALADGTFDINTSSFVNGTYTVKMTAVSALNCYSEEASTTFSISIQPTISVTPLAAICEKTASVTVNYATTDAATYSYTLKDASNTAVASVTDATASATGSFNIATATLADGIYTLALKAKSAAGCSSVETTTTLTINPQPTVTIDPIAAVCYPTASITVTYGTTDAAKYSYQVYNGATPVAGLSATDATVGTSFNINTSSLAAGTYTLKMTVKSAHECISEEATTTFTINEQPTLTLNPVAAVCFGTASVTVNYTSTFAATYDYQVVNASNATVAHAENQAAAASGSFNFATATLPAGTYVVKVTAKSAADCGSTEVTTNLTINPKPTIAITPIEAICESTASVTVSYTTTDAATYSYQLLDASNAEVASATDATASANGSFSLATASLPDGTYTLKMTAKSAFDCLSDEASTTITINNQPTVTLDAIAAICQGDAVATVSYHTTDAAKYSYQVLNASNSVVASAANQTALADGTFDINTSSFANGTYTVKMTAVSALNCNSEEASTTFSISIQPTISVTPLAAICEKTASVTVNYATTDAATYSYTLKNASNDVVASVTDATASANGSFNIATATLADGTYTLALKAKSAAGCLSVETTTTLTINPQPIFTLSPIPAVCFAAPTTDVAYTSADADKYSYQLLDASNAVVASASNQTALASGTIVLNTESLPVGTYTLKAVATSNASCISEEASISFNVIDLTPIETVATICNGESYDWVIMHPCNGTPYTLMKNLTASCVEYDTIKCPGVACSSVYKLTLTVRPAIAEHYDNATICKGESYSWHGNTYNVAGSYTTTIPSLAHPTCDSILHLNLIVTEPTESYATAYICEGESFTFGSRVLTLPGDYHDTITSGACVTAIYHLALYESEKWGADETVNHCGTSYTWRGHTYDETGVYYDTIQSSHGCDSIMTLNLFITKPQVINESRVIRTIDLPYTFTPYPYTYTSAGTYNEVVTSLLTHCDSIIYNFTLTINNEIETIIPTHEYATICEGGSATWTRTGATYTEAGTYTQIDGDATHYFHLTINPTYNKTINVTHCGASYTWHGNTYNVSGTYNWTGTSISGCDSIETLNLTLASASPVTNINATICKGDGYPFGGQLRTIAGTYNATFTNMYGCDSVVNLTLAVLAPVYGASQSATICDGEDYMWQGSAYSVAGTYYDTVPSLVSGCDSILTLTLSVKPAYHFEEDVEVRSDALPFDWTGHGQVLTSNGDYYDNHVAMSGCDSIYHIHFHVNFVTRDTLHLTDDEATPAAQCDSYTWTNGQTYTATGLYSDTVWTNAAHTEYNAVHFLDLEIKHSVTVYESEIVSCDNEFLYWQCNNYTPTAGLSTLSTTLTAANGCDSTIVAPWRVYESYKAPVENKTICKGEVENWRGHSFKGLAAGSYTFADTLSRVTGCDSIFTLNLTVTPRTAPDTVTYEMCTTDSYDWQGYHIANKEDGVYNYYKYYTPAGECETYHMLTITVSAISTYADTVETTVCEGYETFMWLGHNPVTNALDVPIQDVPETYGVGQHIITTPNRSTVACGDTTYTLILNVTPIAHNTIRDTICSNETYTWHGITYSASGTYTDTLTNPITGCDSICVLELTKLPDPVDAGKINVKVCQGESYNHLGLGGSHIYTPVVDMIVKDTIRSIFGCDSVYTKIKIAVMDTLPISNFGQRLDTDPCYIWDAAHPALCDPGIYTGDQYYADNGAGCDVRHIVSLQVFHILEQNLSLASVCAGTPVTVNFFGKDSTITAGVPITLVDTIDIVDVTKVDTIRHLNITFDDVPFTSDTTVYVLQGTHWTWPGHEWMTPDVTPVEPAIHEANTAIPGTYRYYDLVSCDSIFNLTLNVILPPSLVEHETLCSNQTSYIWALHPTHTINPLVVGETVLNDSTLIDYGTPEHFWRYDTVYVTVNQTSDTLLPDTIVLQGQTFDFCGVAQNTATPHSELLTTTLTSSNGCDSIVTQNLCVAPYEETTAELCYGEHFAWRGNIYGATTDITETAVNPYGCDSVFHLVLTVTEEPTEYPMELYFSSFLPYPWRNITMTAYDYVYYDTVRTANGCDLEYYSAKVLTKPVILTDTMLCPGAICVWQGESYTTPASPTEEPVFVQIETATNILALRLSAYETFLDNQDTLIYRGDPTFEWKDEQGGVMETFLTNTHGVYDRQVNLTSLVTGCDSIYKLHLVIVGDTVIEKNDTLCEGQTTPYEWPEAGMSIPMSELPATSVTYTFHDTVNVRVDSVVVYTLNLFYGETFYQTDYDTITYTKGHTYTYHDSTYVNLGEGSHILNGFYLTTAGCDSVYTDSLWVLPHPVVDSIIHIDSVICEGDYIDWQFRGETVQPDGYHLTGDLYRMTTIFIESGTVAPDTVYHYSLSLSSEKVDERLDVQQIPNGGSYTWTDLHSNVIILTSDTTVADTLHYMSGCDSIISKLILTVAPMSTNKIITDTVCQDEFYVWHHDTVPTDVPGTYEFNERYQNYLGGDSILTMRVTVVPKGNSNEVVVLSPMDANVYTWNGHEYHAGMDETFQLDTVSSFGCDSVATLRVMTGLLSPDTTKAVLCSDETIYHWMRQSVDTVINPAQTGLYYAKMPTFLSGVDSVFVLSLKVLPSYTTYTNEVVCAGGLYLNDTIVNDTVRYAEYGCDSLYTVRTIHVQQGAELMVSAYDTVPQGSNYEWGSISISNIQQPEGYYEYTLGPQVFTSVAGCDSTVWMHLYVAPEYHFRDTVKICLGESYYWPRTQQTYTPDRPVFFEYEKRFVSSLNMDSIYHLVIAVQPTYNKVENAAIESGETYRWRSGDYNATGVYYDNYTTTSGCDSIFQLNLYVGRISKDTVDATTCDNVPYEWNVGGQVVGSYTEPGLNFYTLHVSANPAYDSILVLNLTVNPSYDYVADIYWPQDSVFAWDQTGSTYPTDQVGATTYSAPYVTAEGCDSVYNINLHVEPTYFIQLYDTVCEIPGMDMHGVDSLYTEYLHTRAGNDSIVEHHLFIHGIAYVDQTDTVCHNDGTMWRGQNISILDPGYQFLTDQSQTSYGCDSIFQLRFFVYPDYLFVDYDTIPDSEVYGDRWRGIDIPLLTTGNYTYYDSLQTITGCDSVFQLDLTIRPTYMIEEQKSMCDNDTLNWEGHYFEGVNFEGKIGEGLDAGVYYDTVYFKTTPNYIGQPVDSVRTLVLTVNPIKFTEWVDTICPTDQALVGSRWVSEAGDYWDTISTAQGCDSVCHLTLYNYEQYDSVFYDTICYNEPYLWMDSTYVYEAGGTYSDQRNFTTIHGCDSIIRLQLTVENLTLEPKREEACMNDIVHWAYRRPMSLTDSIDIDIEITTPDSVGEYLYIDTIQTPLGCIYYDSLYIKVVEPVIIESASADQFCADDIDLVINYTVNDTVGGEPREYYIYFSDAAHQQGFVDKEAVPMANTGSLLVETMFSKEYFPRPDTYEATLYLSNGSCQDTSAMTAVTFSFDVLYPSWFAEQHWNDLLAVLSPAYTTSQLQPQGYEFSAYQWYFNGEEIEGANASMLYYLHNIPTINHHYDGEPLPAGSYYQVLLTRVDDGKSILTCPMFPEEVNDHSVTDDFYFSVNPTFVDRDDPYTNVLSNTTGTYTLFDAAGKRLAMGRIEGCEHNAMEIELPSVPGTYLLTMESDEPNPYTGTILRITYKLLVY